MRRLSCPLWLSASRRRSAHGLPLGLVASRALWPASSTFNMSRKSSPSLPNGLAPPPPDPPPKSQHQRRVPVPASNLTPPPPSTIDIVSWFESPYRQLRSLSTFHLVLATARVRQQLPPPTVSFAAPL